MAPTSMHAISVANVMSFHVLYYFMQEQHTQTYTKRLQVVLGDASKFNCEWIYISVVHYCSTFESSRKRRSPGWGGGDGHQVTVSRGGGGGLQGYLKANCGTLH